MSSNARKHWVDYLRVVAIIGVITIHVTAHFYSDFKEVGQLDWWFAYVLNSVARFSVPLFVMISGAVLLGRNLTTGEFYLRRSARLIPPIIFWTILYIEFSVYQGRDITSLIWFLKIGLFASGQASFHLWYLSMFACLMLFAPFINKFINGEKPSESDLAILLGLMLLFFLLNSISSIANNIFAISIEWFKIFPWYIAYFVGGYYLEKYSQNFPVKNSVIFFSLTILLLSGAAAKYYLSTSYGLINGYFVFDNTGVLVFFMATLIFLLAKKNSSMLSENKIIRKISDASFGMYLIHPVLLYFFENNLPSYDSNALIYVPLVIFLTTLGSLFSIIFMRKLSFMRVVC